MPPIAMQKYVISLSLDNLEEICHFVWRYSAENRRQFLKIVKNNLFIVLTFEEV